MSQSLASSAVSRQHNRLDDIDLSMAKADLKNVEALEQHWRERIGGAVLKALRLAEQTQKEGAALLGRDQAQVARWIAGGEGFAALAAILSREELRIPMVLALAGLAEPDGVQIEHVITVPGKRGIR